MDTNNSLETVPTSAQAARVMSHVSRLFEGSARARSERALWRFCRVTRSVSTDEELSAYVRSLDEGDWRSLLALAQIHGVAPLIFWRLAHADLLAALPTPIASAFKESYTRTLVNNRRMQSVFREVVGALTAAGVNVMPLKGLALARRYYHDVALRPMTDMDLLVRRADVRRAATALRRLGFQAAEGMGSPSGFYALTTAVVVYARAQSLSIETHWELFGRQAYRPALPAADVWVRSQELRIYDQSVRYLHPRDELWYLCVHAAVEHRLERLIWLIDIAELVDALPADWDWQRFTDETVAAGVALPVAAVLAYCCAYLRLTIPADALDRLYAAAETSRERAACASAQAVLLSAEWIQMTGASVHGAREKAIFLRGVVAPHRATLAALYGQDATRWRAIPGAYMRHALRTAGPAVRALRAAAAANEDLP